jgi:hypothetical protein
MFWVGIPGLTQGFRVQFPLWGVSLGKPLNKGGKGGEMNVIMIVVE